MHDASSSFIPRSVLFGNPEKSGVKISPNGQFLSYIAPHNGVLNIFIASSETLDAAQPCTFDSARGIRHYAWTYHPDYLIYSQDCDGDENMQLFSLNIRTHTIQPLSPSGSLSEVMCFSETHPNSILFANNTRLSEYFDIYRFDIVTGEHSVFFENQKQFTHFLFDENLDIKFASTMQSDGSILWWQYDGTSFHEYAQIPFEDCETTTLLGLTQDAKTLYLIDSRHTDKAALWSIDLATNDRQLLGSSEKVDIVSSLHHPHSGVAQAYIVNYLKPQTIFLDPLFKEQWSLVQNMCHEDMRICSRSTDDRIWIVAFTVPHKDLKYYLYDTVLQRGHFLFSARPNLQKYPLNLMEPQILSASDGLELVSYLTLPHQKTLATKDALQTYPLILLVHGGPVARDHWQYHAEHQWLSNRGFAVLSINYRSSSGFGKSFIRAGDGQWSKKMHTDLLDGVQWAIDRGITTSDQIAIYGGSYGGYATLVGLSMTPDVFKCGIDIVGPSNLETLLKSIPPYWAPYKATLRRRLGLNAIESAQDSLILAEASPLTFANRIERPILIAQGANDPRVKQAESDQIIGAMKENGIPYTYLLFPTEGHGFARPENNKAFYALAEQFLAQQFDCPCEPIHEEIEKAQIAIEIFPTPPG